MASAAIASRKFRSSAVRVPWSATWRFGALLTLLLLAMHGRAFAAEAVDVPAMQDKPANTATSDVAVAVRSLFADPADNLAMPAATDSSTDDASTGFLTASSTLNDETTNRWLATTTVVHECVSRRHHFSDAVDHGVYGDVVHGKRECEADVALHDQGGVDSLRRRHCFRNLHVRRT